MRWERIRACCVDEEGFFNEEWEKEFDKRGTGTITSKKLQTASKKEQETKNEEGLILDSYEQFDILRS